MLLAIDIGNSNVSVGLHRDGQWLYQWRIQTVRERMPDEYGVFVRSFFEQAGMEPEQTEQAIISSVVPQLTLGMAEMVERQVRRAPLVLHYGVDVGITIETEHPQATGNDLVANAVAGWNHFHSNCVVVNFGTATTLTAVGEPGRFLGVAIAAGLATTADALAGKAAQLAHIPLAGPPSVIGRNTEHSMQSGLVLGHVAMVEGLLDRMRVELPGAKVIATGGLVSILAPLTTYFDAVDPWLTLEGLRLIAERNRG